MTRLKILSIVVLYYKDLVSSLNPSPYCSSPKGGKATEISSFLSVVFLFIKFFKFFLKNYLQHTLQGIYYRCPKGQGEKQMKYYWRTTTIRTKGAYGKIAYAEQLQYFKSNDEKFIAETQKGLKIKFKEILDKEYIEKLEKEFGKKVVEESFKFAKEKVAELKKLEKNTIYVD